MGAEFNVLDESIGVITLDSGKVNTLSRELIEEVADALRKVETSSLRCVILRAKPGAKVFSAGHEVTELPTNGRDPLTYTDPLRLIVREIQLCPQPVIAMVEGSVWGGACELVLGCDLIIAGDDTTFAMTSSKMGVPYNVSGALNFIKVAGLHILKEMLFTAEPVSALRLETLGVINHVCPRAELEEFTLRLAGQIAKNSPMVHRVLKEEIRVLANAHPINAETFERLQALRREVYDSGDYQEGIKAFFEKRPPRFQGF